jgi:ketosteroid isomerase-like protein
LVGGVTTESRAPDPSIGTSTVSRQAVVQATGRDLNDLEIHVWTFHPDGRVASLRHIVDTVQHSQAVQR